MEVMVLSRRINEPAAKEKFSSIGSKELTN
jgi:hypothetical protein